jgi:glycosyltransferase involved in cell wall biosynthesis
MPLTFSVVIPAYNQAEFLGEAIDSVLAQTYQHFEVIVVNDASPDNTEEVVRQYTDPRIKYIRHAQNKGLPAARNTGMRAATGDCIALLDSDDYFHPEKLAAHAAYLEQHPEVGVAYNARFELMPGEKAIRGLHRPSLTVVLRDFLFGYPFAPSDMVIRKSVVKAHGFFDESFRNGGEDMEYPATLALAGCQFASVDRSLTYRRRYSGRYRKNLDARLLDVQRALEKTYADPRCPEEIRQLGNIPLTEHYIVLIYLAFIQDRTEVGQRFLEQLLTFNPGVINGNPCQLVEYFAHNSVADEKDDHEAILRKLFFQLPEQHAHITKQYDWAIREGYLIKGVRAAIWNRQEATKNYFQKAAEVGASFDERHLKKAAHQLVDYEIVMSDLEKQAAAKRLLPHVHRLSNQGDYKHFMGELAAKRAFENYQRRKYGQVIRNVLSAFWHDPHYLFNRGMYALLLHSFVKR